MKNHILALFIGVILFIIPFFWLKPGEMNLGGDSGRLYFYDPYSFIKYYALYNFNPSGTGGETSGFVFLPLVFSLFVLKILFQSPTILIGISNGLILSVGFLSIYFIVREIIGAKEFGLKKSIITYSSILAGLFYVLSQELTTGGWANALITQNQLFLNPLMFLLIMRYFLTKKYIYVVSAVLVSFIFAPNFSFIGAPTFFAFYPLSLVFLFCYVKYIRKITIPYKGLLLGVVLFLFMHSFYLFSELSEIFSFSSIISKTIFTQGLHSRSGLDYFIAVAASTNVSLSWLSLNQGQKAPLFAVFIIMPILLVSGFYLNKGKALILSGLFFLITLFLATANITDTGFFLYKLFFKLPAFSMFRNFHGQWVYVFMFFYTLLFGQAIALILNRLTFRRARLLIMGLGIFILFFSFHFLDGSIPVPTYKDSGLRYAFRMDPMYEKVLDYYKKYPIDGKIISFPFTGPGYQVLQGKDGGVYQGIPMSPYLAGKSNFAGFGTLYPYDNLFLDYMKREDFPAIKKLFSIMNIKQVFYNSDPFIYSNVFKGYLYAHVSEYNPKNQRLYKSFIEKLPVTNPIHFGNKYHLYAIDSDEYLPHIFATTDVAYTNDQLSFTLSPYITGDIRKVPISIEDSIEKDNVVLFASPQTFLLGLINNSHFHKHDPFINHALDDVFYWSVALKERFDLYRAKSDYFNTSSLILTKRISELVGYGDVMSLLKKKWQEPNIWEIYRLGTYNSWEASLTRYEKGMGELISWVVNSNESIASQEANRIRINEQLFQHQIKLIKSIKNMSRKNSEKKYIHSLTNNMFNRLFQKINIPIYNPSKYYYDLPDYPGNYSVHLQTKDLDLDLANATLSVNKMTLKPILNSVGKVSDSNFLPFNNYSFEQNTDTRLVLNIPAKNLVDDIAWDNSGKVLEANELSTLLLNNTIGENTGSLMLSIPNWIPDNTYLINFDYMTEGNDFVFSFIDKKKSADELIKNSYKLFFEKILNSKTWKTHQSIINAEAGTKAAFMKISPFSQKDISKMHIKNLSVTKIQYPTIIFKKTDSGLASDNNPPKITFTKINPTKFSVRVSGAKNPYGLVFLESFNHDWQLVDPTIKEKTIMSSALRFIGALGQYVVSIFVKDIRTNDVVASYFNGEVREGKHDNRFIDSSTFETWGKTPIAQGTHTKTFEYANMWIINPQDMQGRSEYTLILEADNHKIFYIFGFISLLTLICLVIYSVKAIIFKHEKNN